MATGKKPASFYVVRQFRGQTLYLASLHTGNGSRFVADIKGAMTMGKDVAVATAKRCSVLVGTVCTAQDANGCAVITLSDQDRADLTRDNVAPLPQCLTGTHAATCRCRVTGSILIDSSATCYDADSLVRS